MSFYEGWKKADSKLVMNATDDVSVSFVADLGGSPFFARVGTASCVCPSLDDAVGWCQETYRGMMVLLGPEPLAETDLDSPSEADANRQFLEERGLKA